MSGNMQMKRNEHEGAALHATCQRHQQLDHALSMHTRVRLGVACTLFIHSHVPITRVDVQKMPRQRRICENLEHELASFS